MRIERVCVHFPRFGPLHLNRTRAAHEVLGRAGITTIALETASVDTLYRWREERGATPFQRETIFPGRNYNELAPAEVHRGVIEALDRLAPDAVHIHSYATPDARACLAWCRRNRRIAVCMAESKADDAPRVAWRESVKRLLVRQFDSAQASGTLSERYAVELGIPPDRIFAGYSVVDNDRFAASADAVRRNPAPARTLPGLGDETPFFFASARFMDRKDLPTLLRAYAAYRRGSPDPWRLVLLGDGPLRATVEALIRDEAIEGVTLPGWRQNEDLPSYYALASAFVHTALVDQWGLVVNEAMASGLPVLVSTGAGCSVDLVRDGENGYTFAPGDAGALARALHTIAHESDLLALGCRSREIIAEWPLERFGTSLLDALRAGAATADRGLDPRAALVIWALQRLSSSAQSFHSVDW